MSARGLFKVSEASIGARGSRQRLTWPIPVARRQFMSACSSLSKLDAPSFLLLHKGFQLVQLLFGHVGNLLGCQVPGTNSIDLELGVIARRWLAMLGDAGRGFNSRFPGGPTTYHALGEGWSDRDSGSSWASRLLPR